MKVRLEGPSIRLRLTQTDVAQLHEHGQVQETTPFPSGRRLTVTLEASDAVQDLAADLADGRIVVYVPRARVAPWVTTDQVGFEGAQALDDGGALTLIVEKDFECLHKPTSTSDAFPHPRAEES